MKDIPKEIEIKFYLAYPEAFPDRLINIGARLKRERCHELNLLLDDAAGGLQATGQILRLRKDDQATLTYKGKGEAKAGVLSRTEIEVIISDFAAGQALFEGLGYQPRMIYEKYRTSMELNGCEVVLDQLPYGWFCEIEGTTPQHVRATTKKMGLHWDARIIRSYRMLFEQCKHNMGLTFTDLTFNNFKGIIVTPEDLEVKPSDA